MIKRNVSYAIQILRKQTTRARQILDYRLASAIQHSDTHLHYHQGFRSSHPWDGSMLRTWGSCLTHTPDSPYIQHLRHAGPRHQARHSHPLQRHKDCQECNIACRDSFFHCTFHLEQDLIENDKRIICLIWPAGGSCQTPFGICITGAFWTNEGFSQQSSFSW